MDIYRQGNARHLKTMAKQGSAKDLAKQGSVNDLAKQGSANDLAKQGSASKSKRECRFVLHFASSNSVQSYSLDQIRKKCQIKSSAGDTHSSSVPKMSEREMLQAILDNQRSFLQIFQSSESPSGTPNPASNPWNSWTEGKTGRLQLPVLPELDVSAATTPADQRRPGVLPKEMVAAGTSATCIDSHHQAEPTAGSESAWMASHVRYIYACIHAHKYTRTITLMYTCRDTSACAQESTMNKSAWV